MLSSEPSEPPQHLSCCVSKISVLLTDVQTYRRTDVQTYRIKSSRRTSQLRFGVNTGNLDCIFVVDVENG